MYIFYPTRPSILVLICVFYYSYSGKYISWFVLFIITEFGFIYWFFIIQILGEYNYSYTAHTEDLDILSSIFKKKKSLSLQRFEPTSPCMVSWYPTSRPTRQADIKPKSKLLYKFQSYLSFKKMKSGGRWRLFRASNDLQTVIWHYIGTLKSVLI